MKNDKFVKQQLESVIHDNVLWKRTDDAYKRIKKIQNFEKFNNRARIFCIQTSKSKK